MISPIIKCVLISEMTCLVEPILGSSWHHCTPQPQEEKYMSEPCTHASREDLGYRFWPNCLKVFVTLTKAERWFSIA